VLFEVRLLDDRVYIQVVVPETGRKVCLEAANLEPFHQSLLVVSSMDTRVLEMLAPAPAAAVPVIVPVQFVPYVVFAG
jgi:hypothetical protein